MTTTDYRNRRMPREHQHGKACLAAAMLSAVENLRDDEGLDDHTFRAALADGEPLAMADDYLADGLCDCRCPQADRVRTLAAMGLLDADDVADAARRAEADDDFDLATAVDFAAACLAGLDTWSSASVQHYIDTGEYLPRSDI